MIIYTGTHDNDTLMEWYEGLSVAEKRKVRRFLSREGIRQGSVKERLLTYTVKEQGGVCDHSACGYSWNGKRGTSEHARNGGESKLGVENA